jgi:hypothetical protein
VTIELPRGEISFVELLGSHENKISPDEEEDSQANVL